MINVNAVLNGDKQKLLGFDSSEQPLALQVGGSEPKKLARVTKIAHEMGYREINLNCGCPSKKVISGNFGVTLMQNPTHVAECYKAMKNAANIEVTVKHRLAIDDNEDYEFTYNFVKALNDAGCKVFIVHARNAILSGISPKKNRCVPPIRMTYVRKLKKDFSDCTIVANGELKSVKECIKILDLNNSVRDSSIDGIMIGRGIVNNPWMLVNLEESLFTANCNVPSRPENIIYKLDKYFKNQIKRGCKPTQISKQWKNLFKGQRGSKLWNKFISEGFSPVEAFKKFNLM